MKANISLQPRYLSLSVATLLTAVVAPQAVWANDATATQKKVHELPTIEIVAEQGTKNEFNVVTLEEKNESTETDLRGLLRDEAAMEIGGGNGTSQYWSIRGMGQNSIDVKIDNGYSDSGMLYHQGRFMLDPALIKTVEIQKGAGSASAGIGATNGAVVVKTVDALDLLKNSERDYGFRIGAGYNTNDSFNYTGTVFGKFGNFDALFSYNKLDDDHYKAGKGFINNSTDVVPNSALDKESFLGKVGATFGAHRFVLSHMQEQHSGIRLVREEFLWSDSNANLSLSRQSPAYRETTLRNSNLEYTAKDLGKVLKNVTANAYLLQNERYSADDRGCGYCGNVAGPTTTKIDTKGANINFDWQAGANTILKTGVNYRHQEVTAPFRLKAADLISVNKLGSDGRPMVDGRGRNITENIPIGVDVQKPEKTDIGAYLEAIGEIGQFTLTGGLRYDYFEYKGMDGKALSDSQVNPSVALTWKPLEQLSLSAVHNYATRSPRLYDAILSHGRRGAISIADGTVAERAKNTELGFNYNHDFANNSRLTLKGSYFWQRIDDALANPQDRHDVRTIKEAVNAGYIKNKGYEVDLAYKVAGFTAKVGVAHSKPRLYDTHPNNLLSANNEYGVQTGRTWTTSVAYRFSEPNLELGARNRYVEKASESILVRAIAPQNRNSYVVTDIFANWKPLSNDKLNVNFAVNNVADKFYYSHSQRPNGGLPAVGRDFRIGMNYTF